MFAVFYLPLSKCKSPIFHVLKAHHINALTSVYERIVGLVSHFFTLLRSSESYCSRLNARPLMQRRLEKKSSYLKSFVSIGPKKTQGTRERTQESSETDLELQVSFKIRMFIL